MIGDLPLHREMSGQPERFTRDSSWQTLRRSNSGLMPGHGTSTYGDDLTGYSPAHEDRVDRFGVVELLLHPRPLDRGPSSFRDKKPANRLGAQGLPPANHLHHEPFGPSRTSRREETKPTLFKGDHRCTLILAAASGRPSF